MTSVSEIKSFKTKEVSVDSIAFSPYNPRKINPETMQKLKASLTSFGLVDPIIVNKRNMQVVGGNQRLRALKELGVSSINAIFVDLDDEKEKALNVALNKISGEWDFDKLKELMTGLCDVDKALTGFNAPEIDILTGNLGFSLPPTSGSDYSGAGNDSDEDGSEDFSGERENGSANNGSAPATPATQAPDGVSYIVYVSFSTKEAAELFLMEHGVNHEFSGGNRTFVWRK